MYSRYINTFCLWGRDHTNSKISKVWYWNWTLYSYLLFFFPHIFHIIWHKQCLNENKLLLYMFTWLIGLSKSIASRWSFKLSTSKKSKDYSYLDIYDHFIDSHICCIGLNLRRIGMQFGGLTIPRALILLHKPWRIVGASWACIFPHLLFGNLPITRNFWSVFFSWFFQRPRRTDGMEKETKKGMNALL